MFKEYKNLLVGKESYIFGLVYLLGNLGSFISQMKNRNISLKTSILILIVTFVLAYSMA